MKKLTRILVVDDDPGVRDATLRILERAGYQVTSADDGESALELLRADKFDLLITDHNMPAMSGLALIGFARSLGAPLILIVMSGSLSEQDRRCYEAFGVAAVLPKPFAPKNLMTIVEQALNGVVGTLP